MYFLKLVFAQFKLNCKDKTTLITLILNPIVIVLGLNFTFNFPTSNPQSLAVVNQDQGELANEMLEFLDADIILVETEEEALFKLEYWVVAGVYVIPEDFSSSLVAGAIPEITVYQRELQNLQMFDEQIQEFLQEQARQSLFIKYGLQNGEQEDFVKIEFTEGFGFITHALPVVMCLFMLFAHSSAIAQKIVGLKTSNVLRRLSTTPNNTFTIILVFCVSYFFTQVILTGITLSIFMFVFNYEIVNPFYLTIAIILLSLLSISFGIVAARICKNPVLIEWGITVLTFIPFVSGMTPLGVDMFSGIKPLQVLSQFSPFYWISDMVFNGNLFPGVIILILMIFVMLTAGSLNRDQFLQE